MARSTALQRLFRRRRAGAHRSVPAAARAAQGPAPASVLILFAQEASPDRRAVILALLARHGVGIPAAGVMDAGEAGVRLRWPVTLGPVPRRVLSLEALRRTLHGRFARRSYVLSEQAYASSRLSLGFTGEERSWLAEVFEQEDVSRLLRVFRPLPAVIVHRVKRLPLRALGQCWRNHIAIASSVYASSLPLCAGKGAMVAATPEALFKITVIHELCHFVDAHTGELACKRWPLGTLAHDLPPLLDGRALAPDEDLAVTLSLYLACARSHSHLRMRCPRRYRLMRRYFQIYLPRAEACSAAA